MSDTTNMPVLMLRGADGQYHPVAAFQGEKGQPGVYTGNTPPTDGSPIWLKPEGGDNGIREPLTFTGGSNAVYDGTAPVSVEIPKENFDNSPFEILVEYTTTSAEVGVSEIIFTKNKYPKLNNQAQIIVGITLPNAPGKAIYPALWLGDASTPSWTQVARGLLGKSNKAISLAVDFSSGVLQSGAQDTLEGTYNAKTLMGFDFSPKMDAGTKIPYAFFNWEDAKIRMPNFPERTYIKIMGRLPK